MRLYYTFRFKYNNQLWNDRTTPSEIFRVWYPEFWTSVQFTDFPDENYLVNTTWERFWYVDIDEVTLWQFWYTIDDVKEELVNNNQIKIYLKDNIKASGWLRVMTNFEETSPWIFLVSEENEFNWQVIPKVELNLN